MKKTIIWEILGSLSPKELKEFSQFLHSPMHNTRKDLIKLNAVLIKKALSKREPPAKEWVFKQTYPTEIYDYQKLRLAFSRLHKLLEGYLLIKELENEPFEREKLIVTAYRRRKLPKNFNKTFKRISKELERQPLHNPKFYTAKFDLEYQRYRTHTQTKERRELFLDTMDNYLNISFISTKLRQACFSLSHQAISDRKYQIPLLQEVVELAQKPPYATVPSILIYHQFINLFNNDAEIDFETFKENLFSHQSNFTEEEFRDIYFLSLNFCIRKINSNQRTYFQRTLDLYKQGLTDGLLFESGKLSRFAFNNIVGIALRIDNTNWVEHFIQSHEHRLPEAYRHTTFNLNMARLAFVRKHFKQALRHLLQVESEDLGNDMTAKILQAKIYYELDEMKTLESLLQSTLVHINRKKKIGYHHQLWKNIIHYIQKIMSVNPYDKKAISALKNEIQREEILTEKEWLLEKLRH